MRRAVLALTCLAASPALAHDPVSEIDGRWVNESGSVMIVQANAEGRLSGRYCSELGRVEPESCHPLTGWVAGDVVGFAVRFDPPGSVTAWSGQIGKDADGPYLRTLWHLSRDVAETDEADRLWESVISGFAVFRPAAKSEP